MPVPAPQQHTENWVFGPFLLHRSEWGHYVLYGPEAVTSEPFEFLAGFGIDNHWTCEWESMDGIVITHLLHPDFFSS